MNRISLYLSFLLLAAFPKLLQAQDSSAVVITNADLQQCVHYALEHQPSVRQAILDEQITENNIKNKLADWYPQINLGYNVQHFLQLPTSFIPDASGSKKAVRTGAANTSGIQLSVSQSIFNRDVLLARQTAADVREQSRQLTTGNKIDIAAAVSKAFYDVLLTQKQVQVLDENIKRLERSLQDAYEKYKGGIVDKIDYKRAQISLNNTRADRKRAQEAIDAKFAYLKQLMGLPAQSSLSVAYDSLQMERDIAIDTLQHVEVANRIEYQLLQTQQSLLQSNLQYNKWSFLPSLSAQGSYNPSFLNDRLTNLYGVMYPSSYIGLQLAFPIFQGGKRNYNINAAKLQLDRIGLSKTALQQQVNTQYAQALAAYKGNLAQLNAQKDNLKLAEDVYNTLRLQYDAGIKAYLDVIIAETDLRSAQLNYLDALYQVLASKLDMQKALGTLAY